MKARMRLAVLWIALLMLCLQAQAGAITNGSFEDGLTGWTGSTGGMGWQVIDPNAPPVYLPIPPFSAADGRYVAICKASSSMDFTRLWSTDLLPAGTYNVGLWVSRVTPDPYGSSISLWVGSQGSAVWEIPVIPGWNWQAREITFSSPSRLTFGVVGSGDHWLAMDGVEAEPVPEVAGIIPLALGLIGLAGSFRNARRMPR